MARRSVLPRKVEELARECYALRRWLQGAGTMAAPDDFAVVLRSYLALVDAVAMLPRGPEALRRAQALFRAARAPRDADTHRPAEDFSIEELATMPENASLLTPTGWVCAAPLLPVVDAEREALGPGATDKAALESILRRKAAKRSESYLVTVGRELGALQKRVSVLRTRARAGAEVHAALTGGFHKVPPVGD